MTTASTKHFIWPVSAVARLALRLVGGLFIFIAVSGFFRALWELAKFLSGIFYYGALVVHADAFSEQSGRVLGALIGPLLCGAFGGLCWAYAKRWTLRDNLARQTNDARPPVIYMRSFDVDKRLARRPLNIGRFVSVRTEEEQLVEALREIGPIVAIGRPGERLPRLGAQRIYVEDKDWQQQVLSWFKTAALVVIQVPSNPTRGVTWEIDQSLNLLPLDRLVFLVSRSSQSLDWLNQKLRDHGSNVGKMTKLHRAPYGSPISGIMYFVNGQVKFRALVKPPFFNRPFGSPLVPVYRSALQPVTTQITGSWQPLSREFGAAFFVAVWVTVCTLFPAAGFYLRWSEPLERESMVLGQRLINKLPVEVRQLVEKGDKAAAGAWLQSAFKSGLPYTSDSVVLHMANLTRQILRISSAADCGAISDGTIGEPAVKNILNKLGRQKLVTLYNYKEKVILESLKSEHVDFFPVSEADATAALIALYNSLSEKDKARYHRVTENFAHLTTEEQCWFVRAMYEGIERLSEPSRSKLARLALGQEPGRP
jgi:hypothetical protein